MPHVYEKYGSPEARFVNPVDNSGSSYAFIYVALDYDNATLATAAVAAVAPLTLVDPLDGATLVRQEFVPKVTSPKSFEVTVHYGPEDDRKSREPEAAGDWWFSFDTTGANHKVTQSLETILRKSADETNDPAPDLQGAIGWDGKQVKGADVPVPKLDFSIVASYSPAAVSVAYMKTLARATGKMNGSTWLGFEAGEILYLGSTGEGDVPLKGSTSRTKPIAVTHKFSASENLTNVPVGSITIPSKLGWDYLWVRYKQTESSDQKNLIAKPAHAYVERICRTTDFASLFGVS